MSMYINTSTTKILSFRVWQLLSLDGVLEDMESFVYLVSIIPSGQSAGHSELELLDPLLYAASGFSVGVVRFQY